MKTFVTYLAPYDDFLVSYFRSAEMVMYDGYTTDDTEAGKLWSLAAYAWSILLEKEIYKYCQYNKLDFRMVYGNFTSTYNAGYRKMDMDNVVNRPILEHIDGPIGGHCIMQGVEKLADSGCNLAEIILEMNNNL